MYKFVTLYRRVEEEDLLEDFFSQTHLPLAEKLPGLVRRELCRVSHKPGGESRFHLTFALFFHSRASFEAAMASPTGVQLIEALKPWAEAKIITWFFAESFIEDMARAPEESTAEDDEAA